MAEVAPGGRLPGFRLVTLCGSSGGMHDAMRDSQDIIEPLFQARGIDVRPVDLGRWDARSVPALLREVVRQKPDGILMQYPTGAFGHALGPIFLGLLQRVAPMAVMLHEFVAAHPVRKAAVGALLLRADRVGVTAERERAALERFLPWTRGRIRAVPIASNIPSRPWQPAQPPSVAYFGQLRPAKGIEEFLAVAERMPDAGAEFCIVGTAIPGLPDYASFVKSEAARLGVKLLLGLEPGRVADALSSATAALLPYPDGASFRRGTLFAASACGVPVVTTLGPDTPAELARYVEGCQSPAELAPRLRRLLDDPAALQDAHGRSVELDAAFGWEKTVDHYVAMFSELARMRRGHKASGPVAAVAEPQR